MMIELPASRAAAGRTIRSANSLRSNKARTAFALYCASN
jgi:hypothetical protein